jgi:hypothetical protein
MAAAAAADDVADAWRRCAANDSATVECKDKVAPFCRELV